MNEKENTTICKVSIWRYKVLAMAVGYSIATLMALYKQRLLIPSPHVKQTEVVEAASYPEPVYISYEEYIETPVVVAEEIPEVIVSETPQGIALTDEEFETIARLVAAEARGESFEGQLAVAQVIRDRMEHPNTKQYGGPTINGVIFKKGQFAKPWNGNMENYPGIYSAVEEVFYNDYRVFEEPVLFFYSPAIATAQGPILKYNYVGKIGCHNFHGGEKK